jgi:MYXO-CTERM domain-containing protein
MRSARLALVAAPVVVLVTALAPTLVRAQDAGPPAGDLVLEGALGEGESDYHLVPFEVPAGTLELEFHPRSAIEQNVLDFGIVDADGVVRGWSGSDGDGAIINADAASRGYRPGALPAGEWAIIIGFANVSRVPASYEVDVFFRDAVTLARRGERSDYESVTLSNVSRWYAGDFHVHTLESADATAPIGTVASFAKERGLDFVVLTDHNVSSQVDFIAEAQAAHDDLLLLPGVEFTTYDGHMNGIGASTYVDHRLGLDGWTIDDAMAAFREQDALVSINHPALDLGPSLCMGCPWQHDISPGAVDAIEIQTGRFTVPRASFTLQALELWDSLCDDGEHLAALGGSDDHDAGIDLAGHESPIASPTTLVFAHELSREGILEGIRSSRTVVKLRGPDGPMVELTESPARMGDTIHSSKAVLQAIITGAEGMAVHWMKDGFREGEGQIVNADPFLFERVINAPESGEERWRVEVWEGEAPRTITSNVWITAPVQTGCQCDGSRGGGAELALLALLALLTSALRRRR